MSLKTLVDNTRTDKNTVHSYLDVYDELFARLKNTAENVLEIGLSSGGSIKLWVDYFSKANIWGIDLGSIDMLWSDILGQPRVHLLPGLEGYSDRTIDLVGRMGVKYDIIIDDATHNPIDQITFVHRYLPFLTENGVFVIEDVRDPVVAHFVQNAFPDHLRPFVKIYDRREIKNRSDDILVILDMSTVKR